VTPLARPSSCARSDARQCDVPLEARERIFERFAREDLSRGRDGRDGLGLAISRDIIHAHHGRIWVEYNTPHGSTFKIALPTGAPANP
jgi:two-component system, OmpR family, sensor histidine kinase VicK